MDEVVLFTGFATLAGLLAGYVTARRGRGVHVVLLWAVMALALVLYPIWLDAGTGPAISGAPDVLYLGLIPAGVGVAMGSLLGGIMRAVFSRGERA